MWERHAEMLPVMLRLKQMLTVQMAMPILILARTLVGQLAQQHPRP